VNTRHGSRDGLGVMVFIATFNNTSAISWWSVLYVEKTGEIHRPALNHYKRYHITLDRVHLAWAGFEFSTLVDTCTDCI